MAPHPPEPTPNSISIVVVKGAQIVHDWTPRHVLFQLSLAPRRMYPASRRATLSICIASLPCPSASTESV
jgi:hypothetical protein